ncbi:hypothetical protein [Candidatus Puniceispirillum sp.]|uniref:hypothetical protein n=1 Tax=Candidatus Puniceispirillum sp. TaxID=2026719 RepID=UPI003F6A4BB9
MRGTAALKSIEALYKEAETVINDGVPMVAIVKSAPPVAKPDIPVAARPVTTAPQDTQPDHTQPDPRAQDMSPLDQLNPEQITQLPAAVFDRIEMLSAMAANLDDDSDNDKAKIKTKPETALPAAPVLPDTPPVPNYAGDIQQISDAELENVVKKAVDDIVATTPLDKVVAGNERIESVMANIAEAVGNAETSEPTDASEPAAVLAAPADHGANADPAPISGPVSGTPAQSGASTKAAAAIDLDDLNKIVANTVKSVIREELSNLVQSTVKSTLDELRATHDDKAKSTPSDR